MATTFTPFLALQKPEVGASRDIWGAQLNSNADIIDAYINYANPIGMMADFAGPLAPAGWLIADGRSVSRITYSSLFAIIGTVWGAGDGSTTFNLPRANGRAAVGPGNVTDPNGSTMAFAYAQYTGWLSNQIKQSHLPNYNLVSDAAGNHDHNIYGTFPTTAAGGHSHATDVQGSHNHGGATSFQSVDHQHLVGNTLGAGGVGLTAGGISAGGNTATSGMNTDHVHYIIYDGSHGHNITSVGDHSHYIYADGSHTHNVSLGGGGALFGILQPVMVVTKIIYAGSQAVPHVTMDAAASPDAPAADDLAALRAEVAALRAIIAPPRSRQVQSAPMRGSH